ncbi:MAG TPA: anthrone oxygenase family protein, partial [Steroidobacteraceae bacterium]
NSVILRSWFMPFFLSTTLGCAVLAIAGIVSADDPRRGLMMGGGALYVAGMFLVTLLFNVPLNNALASAGNENWQKYITQWTRWNHVRTFASMGSAALFIAALVQH